MLQFIKDAMFYIGEKKMIIGKCHQIFFHYVEENGPNYKWAYDKDEKLLFLAVYNQDKIMI
jgi:hypothetical protein